MFKDWIAKIEDAVYNTTLSHSSQDLFSKTTRDITKYVASELLDSGEFYLGIIDMSLIMLTELSKPGDNKLLSTEQYKFKLRQYLTKVERQEKTIKQVFAIILGQCSCTSQD